MTDKPKSDPDQRHPDPDKGSKDQYKRHVDGNITVRGQLEVHPPPHSVDTENADREDQKSHRNKSFILSILTLAAVIIYAGLTGWQGWEAHQTLKAIKEQFRLDQRPYISVVKFQIMDDLGNNIAKPKQPQEFEIGKPLLANITFKNVGKTCKTASIDTIMHYHILFGGLLESFKIETTDRGKKGVTIDPGSEHTATVISVIDTYQRESASLNRADVINWDGSQPVVIFGRASYRDVAGSFYCNPYMVKYLPGNWGFMNDITVDGVRTSTTELCPDRE